MSERRLQDRVAVVTGAGQGIGRAIAIGLADVGAKVVIGEINEETGPRTVAEIAAAGGTAHWIHTAVRQPESLRALLVARADANIVVGEGDLPPLRRVTLFAHGRHIVQMRNLLIQYGATNGAEELGCWRRRQAIDELDPIWLRDYHRSAVNSLGPRPKNVSTK